MDVETAPLRNQYAQRIAADIEANRAEQEQLTARLAQLRDDENYLVGLQTASVPAQPTGDGQETSAAAQAASQDAAVPQQRDADPAPEGAGTADESQGAGKKGGRKKTSAGPRKRAAAAEKPPRATAPKRTTAASAKKAEPPLRERVNTVLLETPEQPRSAGEVLAELTQATPGATFTPQAVRQALESLIAAGTATRERQGRSVYYTAKPAPTAADTEEQDTAAIEG